MFPVRELVASLALVLGSVGCSSNGKSTSGDGGQAGGSTASSAGAGQGGDTPSGSSGGGDTGGAQQGGGGGSGGSAPAKVTLIVIQGESNASGIALDSDALATEIGMRPPVTFMNNDTLMFEALDIGTNNELDQYVGNGDTPYHGLELGLANAVDAGDLPNPTYLVKCGASGSWVQQWLPGDARDLWGECTPRIDAAVAWLEGQNIAYRITFWQSLGLNDRYQVGTTPEDFRSRMDTLRAAFRDRYGDPTIRFLSTNFDNQPAQTYDWKYIFDAIAHDDPYAFSIDCNGTTYVDGSVHYDYAGFKLLAKRMVDTMAASN